MAGYGSVAGRVIEPGLYPPLSILSVRLYYSTEPVQTATRVLGLVVGQFEGVAVNHKRIFRIYREEGLSVRRRARKRVAREVRTPVCPPERHLMVQ